MRRYQDRRDRGDDVSRVVLWRCCFISAYENLPLSACLYETASAVGTVGLTLGITPQLHIPSQMVLIVLMYLGRVGGLTLIYAAVSGKRAGAAKLPLDKITVG